MRRLPLLLAMALVILLTAAPVAQAAPPNPFIGAWTGNDPVDPDGDGSTVYMTISGGTTARIMFTDTFGTICVNDGSPTLVFSSTLVGTVSGNELEFVFTKARCGPVFFDFIVGSSGLLVYDPATDTIDDGLVIWHRH